LNFRFQTFLDPGEKPGVVSEEGNESDFETRYDILFGISECIGWFDIFIVMDDVKDLVEDCTYGVFGRGKHLRPKEDTVRLPYRITKVFVLAFFDFNTPVVGSDL
jgi:hypothetical protein